MGAHTLASGLLRFARNDGASVVVKNALVKASFVSCACVYRSLGVV